MTGWSPLIRFLVKSAFSESEIRPLLSFINERTDSQSTPLHYAALRKDVRFVQILLRQGHPVDELNDFLETPLHWAVKQGHSDVVALLISSGAQVDAYDSENLCPTDWALEEGQIHLLPLLRRNKRLTL